MSLVRAIVIVIALAACGGSSAPPAQLAFTELALSNGEIDTTGMVFVPDTPDELLVLEKSGRLSHYRLAADALELLGSFQIPDVRNFADCGAISAAFDPITTQGRYLHVAHCLDAGADRSSRLVRLAFQPPDYTATAASVTTILEVTDFDIRPGGHSHSMGRLVFDVDGILWVPMGDRGVSERAPDPTSPLGKILRIVPSRDPSAGGYTPAPGNPFLDGPDVYAIGLRNPWTATLDHLGRLWVGDVGSDKAEEINVIAAAGQDQGWPASEGPCGGCGNAVDPVFHWTRSSDHPYVLDDAEATPAVTRVAFVGPEYLPNAADRYGGALDHVLLFGDACVGFLRAARLAEDGTVSDAPVGHLTGVVDMRQAPDGFLYAVSFRGCNSNHPSQPGQLVRVELVEPKQR